MWACPPKYYSRHFIILNNYFYNSDIACQLRNALKYDVLFVIAYFNIPENIIQ